MNSNPSPADLRPQVGLSYVKGAQVPPLLNATIPALLQAAAQRFPDRTAAVFHSHNVKWSWAELARKVDACALGLFKLGLKKGDRVGMWGPNSPEWLITQFATARLGLILVNINPAYRLPELEYALNKVSCRAIVTAERFKSSNYVAMLRELAPELSSSAAGRLVSEKLPHLEFVIKTGNDPEPGMLRFGDLNGAPDAKDIAALDAITAELCPDDAINIQFTSGTTGSPKGATLTHRNIVNNGYFTVATMEFTPDDRLCIPVPLYHCFGMVMGVLGCVSAGTVMVFPGEGFDPRVTLDAIARERCTALYGVPSMFSAMLDVANFDAYDLKSLRTGVMAGAPCPVELMKRVNSEMHMSEVTICYGMTETSPVSFQSAIDDPLERRVSTVGRVHPHVEVKIVGSDGNTVSVGVAGEICTRGYSVMLGYWDDDTRSREAVKDGWMHTGDLGVIDEEGFGRIVGRLKDMVIRGGENIYPREVEELLIKNPKIREVQVFGVPDNHFGEELCAFVVCREGQTASEEEIRAFCRDKISHYKLPKYVRFRQELPMTVTGKAQKYKMRDEMIAELGLKK